MWRRVLFRIFVLVLCGCAIVFAIANRGMVAIAFSPLPIMVQIPLYIALFVAVIGGLVCGWVLCWFGQSSWRRQARQSRRMLKKLRPSSSDGSHLNPVDVASEAVLGDDQFRQETTQR